MRTGSPRNNGAQKKRKGLVLLSVLLVCLFLLSASTGFAIFARRSAGVFDREKRAFTARMVCEAALPGAKLLIALHTDEADAPGTGPFVLHTLEFPDCLVTVEMVITPLNDGIPLNGLFLPDGKTMRAELEGPWKALWRRVGAEPLEALVLDFIDKDREPRLGGREGEGCLNRPLLSPEELLLLPEMSEEILHGGPARPGVAPLVTLWSAGTINVNTASAEVLSLLDGLDGSVAADIARVREGRPFASMRDLSEVPSFPPSARARLMNVLSFKSSHFSVSFNVIFPDGQRLPIEVILEKKGSFVETVRWEEP